MKRSTLGATLVTTLAVALLIAPAAFAAQGSSSGQSGASGQSGQSGQAGQAGQQGQDPKKKPIPLKYEEVIVVTASRSEERLLDAPTAMTVIGASEIEISPAKNYADLLREVPGLNVVQTSARDINLSSRTATGTLDAQQLVLIDGRSAYLDFFGFVAWDLLPLDFSEIEQIEVIRGPGSAVWGANAMSGVVNIITKSPRSMGNAFKLKAGGGERGTGFGNILYSGVRDDWSYRAGAGYSTQDAWDRPGPLPSGQPRDLFPNRGTAQPKFDIRVDKRLGPTSSLSFGAGYAGTGGIIHTGIGPFTIEDGSNFWNVQADYNRDALNARVYVNVFDGNGVNLLNGLLFNFKTTTTNVSLTNTNFLFNDRDAMTYGGNYRSLTFDLSIAPGEDARTEGGIFNQHTIQIGDHVTLNAGARVDWFSVLDQPVWSPRGALLVRPTESGNHVFRFSFGRAYQVPSFINNFLDVTIFNAVALPTGPFVFASRAVGNPELKEESLNQFEIGYRGVFGDISVDVAAYRMESTDDIDFYPAGVYTFFTPPPGFPAALVCILPGAPSPPCPPAGVLPVVLLPNLFSYRNIGETVNKGIEVGVTARPFSRQQLAVNYSWQDEPEVTGVPQIEVGIAPATRFNVAWSGWVDRTYYSASVNYVGEAYWTDVLDSRFYGTTDAFTTVNASIGHLFLDGTLEASVRATNLFDDQILQHVFGDIIGRRLIAELMLWVQ